MNNGLVCKRPANPNRRISRYRDHTDFVRRPSGRYEVIATLFHLVDGITEADAAQNIIADIIEHFLRKVRFAMRTAASRGDVDCRYTLPLIELGIPLYDPAKTARQVAEALKQEDRKLIVSVSANVVYVSWAG